MYIMVVRSFMNISSPSQNRLQVDIQLIFINIANGIIWRHCLALAWFDRSIEWN